MLHILHRSSGICSLNIFRVFLKGYCLFMSSCCYQKLILSLVFLFLVQDNITNESSHGLLKYCNVFWTGEELTLADGNTSLIRQKTESQNGCFKKTKHVKC